MTKIKTHRDVWFSSQGDRTHQTLQLLNVELFPILSLLITASGDPVILVFLMDYLVPRLFFFFFL